MAGFTNPTFGIDTAGAFSSTGSALGSSPFGGGGVLTGLGVGSGPTNVSYGASGAKGMDPFTAIAGIGSAVAGIFGAQSSARATEAAAAQAAEATEKAAKFRSRTELAKDIGGFGFDYFTQRYNTGAGAAANRWNQLQDLAQSATFEAQNPDKINLRSAERFDRAHDYASRLAATMPGYQPPIGLFG